jgi:hypothetical protein
MYKNSNSYMLTWEDKIMQPQVLSPICIIQILKISEDKFPCNLEVSIVLSKAYVFILLDVVSVDVYLV